VLDSVYDIILDLKGSNEKVKWLEVCCQLGMTAKWVKDKFPFVSMHMFDFSESVVQWLNTNFPYDANIWKGRIENIQNNESKFENYFDVVTCIDVTEHLPEEVYFRAIDEIHRVLKPGGLLLLMQGICKENPEHINIREESQFVQEFIERGFRYLKTFPYRHHLLERMPIAKFDETDVESQTAGLTCHKNGDQTVSNLLKQGEQLYYDNNIEKAKDVFKEILSINPNHVETINNLGVLAFQQGDLEHAVFMFEQAYSIKQDYVESIENMGKCFEAKGKYHKAIEWFERSLSLGEKSVETLNSMGNCYVQLENLSKARKAYLESLRIDNTQENITELLRILEETTYSVEHSKAMRDRRQKNNLYSLININTNKKKEDQKNDFNILKEKFSKTYYTLKSYNNDKFTTPLWNKFNTKIEKDLLPIPPFSFLRNSTIAWTMVASGGDYVFKEIDFLEKTMGTDKLNLLLEEDFVGDPVIINSPYSTSANSIHHLYHLIRFSEETKKDLIDVSAVIEWGGGYGNMAKLFRRFNNKHTYTIVDTALFSCLQWLYLATIFGEDSVNILRNSEDSIYKGKINLLPVCFAESIDFSADLFIATWSLSESSKYSQDYVESNKFFNAEKLLIAYQDKNDDLPDAGRVGSIAENFGATIKDIDFLPGNHYAFK
jgi:tetratricopeptide (TPR) repeat protein